MGNKVPYNSKALESGFFVDKENRTGKKLLQSIRSNSVEHFQKSVDLARAEFIKPSQSKSNDAEYEEMVRGMIKYLTRSYDVGDGVVFTKIPLEYCVICESDAVKQAIERELEKLLTYEKKLDDRTPSDKATTEKVRSAREKLKAFQETRK